MVYFSKRGISRESLLLREEHHVSCVTFTQLRLRSFCGFPKILHGDVSDGLHGDTSLPLSAVNFN